MPVYTVFCPVQSKEFLVWKLVYVIYALKKKKHLTVVACSLQDDRWVARHRKTEAGEVSDTSLAWYHQGNRCIFLLFIFNRNRMHRLQRHRGCTVQSEVFLTLHLLPCSSSLLRGNQLPPVFWVLPEVILHIQTHIYILFYSRYTNVSKLYTWAACLFYLTNLRAHSITL